MAARPVRPPHLWQNAQRGGTWYVLYYNPTTHRRTFRSTQTTDRAAAELILAETIDDLAVHRRGFRPLPTTEQERITVNDCLDRLLADYTREGRASLPSKRVEIAVLRREIGTQRVGALTLDSVNTLRDRWRAQEYAKATCNRRIAALRRAVNLTVEALKIPDPGKIWKRFDERGNEREGLVEDAVLAQVNAHEPEPAMRDMNEWASWTGQRWNEITSLRWKNFDPRTWTLLLAGRDTKNGAGRPVVLPPGPIREILARRLAARDLECPWIFPLRGARCRDRDRWELAWRRAGLPLVPARRHPDNLVPEYVFHDLRRTGLTNLINADVDEKTAMLISGHKTRLVFDRYNIRRSRDIVRAFESVQAFRGRLPQLPPQPLTPQMRGWQQRRLRRHAGGAHPTACAPADTAAAPARRSAHAAPLGA